MGQIKFIHYLNGPNFNILGRMYFGIIIGNAFQDITVLIHFCFNFANKIFMPYYTASHQISISGKRTANFGVNIPD